MRGRREMKREKKTRRIKNEREEVTGNETEARRHPSRAHECV